MSRCLAKRLSQLSDVPGAVLATLDPTKVWGYLVFHVLLFFFLFHLLFFLKGIESRTCAC